MKIMLAKFCACAFEPAAAMPGTKVYVKQRGVLTFNEKEAILGHPRSVGVINKDGQVKFTVEAEEALAL